MDPRTLPRQIRRSRWLGIVVSIIVLVAWGAFLSTQLEALRRYPWQVSPLAFVAGILLGALYFAGLAWCWALLLQSVRGQPPKDTDPTLPHTEGTRAQRFIVGWGFIAGAIRVWLLSMITRYIPGNIWHILSRVAMADMLGVEKTQVLTSASIEQVMTILGALALVGITLPFWGIVPTLESWLLLLLPIGMLLLHPRIMGGVLGWAAVRLRRPELAWHYTYLDIIWLLLDYTIATLWASLSLYVLLWGLTPVSLSHMPLVVGASALAWVVGYLSFLTPSGLGVREAALVALLAQIYPVPVAIVASLLFRLAATLGEMLAVLVVWLAGKVQTARPKTDMLEVE